MKQLISMVVITWVVAVGASQAKALAISVEELIQEPTPASVQLQTAKWSYLHDSDIPSGCKWSYLHDTVVCP